MEGVDRQKRIVLNQICKFLKIIPKEIKEMTLSNETKQISTDNISIV